MKYRAWRVWMTISEPSWRLSWFPSKGNTKLNAQAVMKRNFVCSDDNVQSNVLLMFYLICLVFLFGRDVQLIAFTTRINVCVFWIPASKSLMQIIDFGWPCPIHSYVCINLFVILDEHVQLICAWFAGPLMAAIYLLVFDTVQNYNMSFHTRLFCFWHKLPHWSAIFCLRFRNYVYIVDCNYLCMILVMYFFVWFGSGQQHSPQVRYYCGLNHAGWTSVWLIYCKL